MTANLKLKYDRCVKRKLWFLLTLLFFPARAPFAQTPPANNPPATNPGAAPVSTGVVVRSETRLVQLNVIVQDKHGNPVTNLKQEDFTLLDNGKPQAIALFSSEMETQKQWSSQANEHAPELPPNVFGNRVRHTSDSPDSVTVVLFDALNTSIHNQEYAKSEVLAFLRQLQPQDHVAIYLLTRQLTVINDFTQDSKLLLQAVERLQAYWSLAKTNTSQPYVNPSDTGILDPKASQIVAGLMNDMNTKQSDLANLERVQITSQALEAIANHVSGIPGRKNLIWVSDSFPVSISFSSNDNSPVDAQEQNFMKRLERVSRVLDQANLAVYPVDASGLRIPSEMNAELAHPFSAYRQPDSLGEGMDEQVTMQQIAERTGGRAFINTNDIQGAIRKTLAESKSTYEIGFYPQHGNWNGQFHELKLRSRKTGLVLRYRKGYFALQDSPKTGAEAQAALQEALWSPMDYSALEMRAMVRSIDLATRKLDLRVTVDARPMRLNDLDGHHKGSLDAIYLQLGPKDEVLAADPLTYNMDFNEKDYQFVLQRGYELKTPLLIQPATKMLRIAVRDSASGTMGSVTIPLEKFLPPQTAATLAPATH